MTNQFTYSVPFTADQILEDYCDKGMTQKEIAVKYGSSQRVVQRAMEKMGIPARIAAKRNQTGEKNDNWKGGRTLVAATAKRTRFSDAGYWYVYKPEHPNAKKNGYVAEHILIATEKAGRPLKKGECVHHLDLNKQNNSPENLVICTRKRHREYHLELEMVAIQLYRQGKVKFEADRGYCLTESEKV